MAKRRRILVMIITLVLVCVCLAGCDGGDHESAYIDDVREEEERPSVKGLVPIEEIEIELESHRELHQFILYDPETYIMFSYVEWIDGGGILEMHNPDGTPRLYDPHK